MTGNGLLPALPCVPQLLPGGRDADHARVDLPLRELRLEAGAIVIRKESHEHH